jgi:hypothetical protein
MHVSYSPDTKSPGPPSLDAALAAVSGAVRTAVGEASRRLTGLGIRHALAGGLAVGIHGAPRNTTDVDFLVGPEAFEGSGLVLVHRAGVPVRVGDVAIDLLPAEEPVLARALDGAESLGGGLAVVAVEPLVLMKLRALRAHDQDDVRRLVRAGADLGRIRDYLAAAEPTLLSRLDWVLSSE